MQRKKPVNTEYQDSYVARIDRHLCENRKYGSSDRFKNYGHYYESEEEKSDINNHLERY